MLICCVFLVLENTVYMIIKNRSGFVNSLANLSLLMYNKNDIKNEKFAGYLYEFCADDKPKISD